MMAAPTGHRHRPRRGVVTGRLDEALRALPWPVLLMFALAVTFPAAGEPAARADVSTPESEIATESSDGIDPALAALALRVRGYWEAMRLRDLATAYRMEHGALTGELDPDVFRDRTASRPGIAGFEVRDIAIEDGIGTAELVIAYQLPNFKNPRKVPQRSRWIAVDGDWYHRPADPPPADPSPGDATPPDD